MPASRACRQPSDRLGGRRAAYRAAQTGASERPPCHAVNQQAESEVGMGDLWLGCSLVFLPISAPSLCWLIVEAGDPACSGGSRRHLLTVGSFLPTSAAP